MAAPTDTTPSNGSSFKALRLDKMWLMAFNKVEAGGSEVEQV